MGVRTFVYVVLDGVLVNARSEIMINMFCCNSEVHFKVIHDA